MKKNTKQSAVWFIALLFFTVAQSGWIQRVIHGEYFTSTAYAEDDEDDEGDEDEDGVSSATTSTSSTAKTKKVITYKTVYVEKIITTLDPVFTTDRDNDGIVDGLDPHPGVHEREYFTDTDDDGIPNAFDKYHDEDDFNYYEQETDTNENGILDSYESLGGS